jgi:hypothetical protein
MIPVNGFLADALAEVLRNAPLTPDKVSFAWRQAVGAAVDRATAIELDGGTLLVRAQSRQWQREVERSTALIRSRLDALLGAGVVRSVRVVAPGTGNKPAPAPAP